MTIDEALNNIGGRFGSDILNMNKRSERRAYIDIYPKDGPTKKCTNRQVINFINNT